MLLNPKVQNFPQQGGALTPSAPPSPFSDLDPQRRLIAEQMLKERAQKAVRERAAALAALSSLGRVAKKQQLLSSFPLFCAEAWPVVEKVPFSWNWHHECLSDELHEANEIDGYKGIYNIPPGTSKSLECSVLWRAFRWAHDPSLRFLTGSYSQTLSLEHNVKLRNIITSDWYRTFFPHVELAGDQNAKEKFETTQGGWSFATSVGGAGTGLHPDWIIIDDPITAQQARSAVEMKSACDWIERTLSSRGVIRGVKTILVMQRLHTDDPTGYFSQKPGWKKVVIPMRYMPEKYDSKGVCVYKPYSRDPRTYEGQLLWPELFSEQKVRALEINLGPYGTAGQLQQIPAPEGGGLFKREWFEIVDALPPRERIKRSARGWDTGATQDGGDDTVGVKISEDVEGTLYVEDCIAAQLGPGGVDALIHKTAQLDGRKTLIGEEQEPGSSGKTVCFARAKSLKGFDYKAMSTTGDKVTRANVFRAQCEIRNVKLVRGDWNEAWLTEMCNFPVSSKDNRVDATSCSFNRMVLQEQKVTRATWGKR